MKNIFIFTLLLIGITFTAKAGNVTIYGTVTDPTTDTIMVTIRTIYTLFRNNTQNVSIALKDHTFSYTWDTEGKPQFVTIVNQKLRRFTNCWLIEDQDSIQCTLSLTEKVFSGRGSEKWKCYQAVIQKSMETGGFEYDLNAPLVSIDWPSALAAEEKELEQWKSRISKNAAMIIGADCFANIAIVRLGVIQQVLIKNKPGVNKEPVYNEINSIETVINQYRKEYTDDSLCHGFYYPFLLHYKIRIDSFYVPNKEMNLTRLEQTIKARYAGEMGKKVLFISIFRFKNDSGFRMAAGRLLKEVTDPFQYSILSEYYNASEKGKLVQFAKFTGTSQEVVDLTSIKDTVMLLDLWFTGCVGCMRIGPQLERIEEALKDKAFKVVSICIDKELKQWKQSLAIGKYSNKKHLNIYTQGKGNAHPFIEYYRFTSYPTLMLINKKGEFAGTLIPELTDGNLQQSLGIINQLL